MHSRIRSSLPLDQQLCRETQLHVVFLLFVRSVSRRFVNADIWLYSGQRGQAKWRDRELCGGRIVPSCVSGGAGGNARRHGVETVPLAFCVVQEPNDI